MIRLFFLLILFLPLFISAQNVAINNDGSLPANSAILDVSSTTKGILIPRMSSLEKLTIQGPAIGLMVFDTDTYSHWLYRGDVNGGWAELLHTYDRHWQKTGTNIYNNNTGFIGIGTNSPGEKLSINGTNPSIQLMNAGSAKAFMSVTGNNFRLGTYANNTTGLLALGTKGVDHLFINNIGRVGIGTSSPSSIFTINGTNPYIELQHENVDKGFMQALGDDLRIGTNSNNTTGRILLATKLVNRMLIDEDGKVAIGTTIPSASILTINDNDPILQLQNNGVSKGFVQLVGDDVKVGTNNTNDNGNLILRTNGSDRLKVDHLGFVTIGNSTATSSSLSIHSDEPTIFLQANNLTMGTITSDESTKNMIIQKTLSGNGKLLINTGASSMYMNHSGHINFGGGLAPVGYKVSVEGKVIATEFTTLPINNWPDYVFAVNYNLMPLHNLKEYIDTHHHLPNIPAASEIESNGIALGDMSHRLMEKVEELTLYILQLKNEIDELKKK